MMSLFSSFDAMCAESNGWKLVNFSSLKTSTSSPSTSSPLSAVENNSNTPPSAPIKKERENSQTKIGDQSGSTKQRMRNPRFALELDGVHCFETIVPY